MDKHLIRLARRKLQPAELLPLSGNVFDGYLLKAQDSMSFESRKCGYGKLAETDVSLVTGGFAQKQQGFYMCRSTWCVKYTWRRTAPAGRPVNFSLALLGWLVLCALRESASPHPLSRRFIPLSPTSCSCLTDTLLIHTFLYYQS